MYRMEVDSEVRVIREQHEQKLLAEIEANNTELKKHNDDIDMRYREVDLKHLLRCAKENEKLETLKQEHTFWCNQEADKLALEKGKLQQELDIFVQQTDIQKSQHHRKVTEANTANDQLSADHSLAYSKRQQEAALE